MRNERFQRRILRIFWVFWIVIVVQFQRSL
jgi:hypothetical protein